MEYQRTEYGSSDFEWEPTYSEAPTYEARASEEEADTPALVGDGGEHTHDPGEQEQRAGRQRQGDRGRLHVAQADESQHQEDP